MTRAREASGIAVEVEGVGQGENGGGFIAIVPPGAGLLALGGREMVPPWNNFFNSFVCFFLFFGTNEGDFIAQNMYNTLGIISRMLA